MALSPLTKEVQKYCDQIVANPGESWQPRMDALASLSALFEGQEGCENDKNVWTKELFRIMKLPIESQVKDLRSQITTAVAKVLSSLAVSAQDAAGPFIRDIMPVLLEVLNSGNKVIVENLDNGTRVVFEHVRFKKGATILAKEAVKSKSVQLREIAHDYLYQVLLQWGKSYLTPEVDVIQGAIEKGLIDASQQVRALARNEYVQFDTLWPDRAADLLARADPRTQRYLSSASRGEAAPAADSPRTATRRKNSSRDMRSFNEDPRGSTSSAGSGGRLSEGGAAMPPPPPEVENSAERPPLSPSSGSAGAAGETLPSMGETVTATLKDGTFSGEVKFVGETNFATGFWVGLELETPDGKNNGAVAGVQYFSCPMGFGLFVRPNQLAAPNDGGGGGGGSAGQGGGGGGAAAGKGGLERQALLEWQTLGIDLLMEHKKHVDTVLSALREEMEVLANFERTQDRLSEEKVTQYHQRLRACLDQRDEMSADLRANMDQLIEKYGK